jgi:hypothetical protein
MLEEMLKVTINYKFKHKFNFIDILVGTPGGRLLLELTKALRQFLTF